MSYNGDAYKRRRVDDFSLYVAPSTSRTAAKARNDRLAQEQAARNAQTRPKEHSTAAPLLDLASLPPASLQRYLSRYGLLEPHGSLSYHHAVFPVPPLPLTLQPPLNGRLLNTRRPSSLHHPAPLPAPTPPTNGVATTPSAQAATETAIAQGEQPAVVAVGGVGAGAGSRGKKRPWEQPKTEEFSGITAFDDPQTVVQRLAERAKGHWDKREGVKEGETLTNFIFALRMRAHTLRATPPG